MTPDELQEQFRAAVKAAIEKGARPEDLSIHWNGMEWRWSAHTRRWELAQDHHPERRGNEVEMPKHDRPIEQPEHPA